MIELLSDETLSSDAIELAGLDLLIVAHGYEERSSALVRRARTLPNRTIAVQFTSGHACSFDSNLAALVDAGCDVIPAEDSDVGSIVLGALEAILTDRRPRIGVDISSFSRIRIAAIVSVLERFGIHSPCSVTFFYSVAEYTPRPQILSPNLTFGPVLDEFAGWFESADAPPVAVVGLGYEQDRALGALEHLQVEEFRLFVPESIDARFLPELQDANAVLLDSAAPDDIYPYSLSEPIATYGRLQSLIRGIKLTGNPLLLPFGPKLFALLCLLIGIEDRTIAIWRVSPEGAGAASDVREAGVVVSLSVEFASGMSS